MLVAQLAKTVLRHNGLARRANLDETHHLSLPSGNFVITGEAGYRLILCRT